MLCLLFFYFTETQPSSSSAKAAKPALSLDTAAINSPYEEKGHNSDHPDVIPLPHVPIVEVAKDVTKDVKEAVKEVVVTEEVAFTFGAFDAPVSLPVLQPTPGSHIYTNPFLRILLIHIPIILLSYDDVYIEKVVSTQAASSTTSITQEGHHNSESSHSTLHTTTTAAAPIAPTSTATGNTSTNSNSGSSSVWGAKRSFVEVVRKPI